jgi:hypothetical protein
MKEEGSQTVLILFTGRITCRVMKKILWCGMKIIGVSGRTLPLMGVIALLNIRSCLMARAIILIFWNTIVKVLEKF